MQDRLQERVHSRAEGAVQNGVHSRMQTFLQLRSGVQERSPSEMPVRNSTQVSQCSPREVQVDLSAQLCQGP